MHVTNSFLTVYQSHEMLYLRKIHASGWDLCSIYKYTVSASIAATTVGDGTGTRAHLKLHGRKCDRRGCDHSVSKLKNGLTNIKLIKKHPSIQLINISYTNSNNKKEHLEIQNKCIPRTCNLPTAKACQTLEPRTRQYPNYVPPFSLQAFHQDVNVVVAVWLHPVGYRHPQHGAPAVQNETPE